MKKSYNGWPASPTLKTRTIEPVKGVKLPIVDNQNVDDVFTYLVQQYHKRVDDVTRPHPRDDWGFAFRDNRNNPGELSCHASGTAVDLDATEHPNSVAVAKTFTAQDVREIHAILRELEGTVRWGGDFKHTVDGMHFEIAVEPGELQKIGSKIRKGQIGPKKDEPKKSNARIANEVIAGKWGNAPQRKARLTKAGYNYDAIQKLVRQKLAKKAAARKKK
jgi:hypothetical protein